MVKYFRGCSLEEAKDIEDAINTGEFNARQPTIFWTDSYEKALMYARRHTDGAVVEVEMDTQPLGITNYFSVGEGDSAATTIRQWELSPFFFERVFTVYVEELRIYRVSSNSNIISCVTPTNSYRL